MRSPHEMYGSPASSVLAEESARAFMQRVYLWMVGGLTLTGVVAYATASNPQIFSVVAGMFMPIVIGQVALVWVFSAIAPRASAPVAAAMFGVYSFTTGLVLSIVFYAYTKESVTSTFFVTAGTFGAMSLFGTVTKRNLSAWSTFLFMGLIGLILASIVNIFLGSDLLGFVVSCAGVVVFAGLTAYDTQKLRTMHADSGFSSAGSLAITGALMLYLDFINLFLYLLRLFGRRR